MFKVLLIILGILISILAGLILRFAILKIQRFDRKLRLYFGVICLIILGIAIISHGIELPENL